MKLKLAILLILILSGTASAEKLETINPTCFKVRIADANDEALDVNQTSWSAITAAKWPEYTAQVNFAKVKFFVYDPCGPNDVTFDYIYYQADNGCNAEIVADGNAVCGAAQLSHLPYASIDSASSQLNSGDPNEYYCWVDTLGAITSDLHLSFAPKLSNNNGNDGIASFTYDRQSAKRCWCRIYNRSSATAVVYVVVYGY